VSVPPILVTGGSGQVAQALGLLGDQRVQVIGRPAFDFDAPATITAALESARPALVVNTAAWTAVDLAESQAEAAWRANAAGPAEIGRWCAAAGVPLIHISTDYVFDGEKGAAYIEADPTSPTGVYGASKLAGEQAVLAACSHAVVLRTSWVYAARGKNFVRTMLALAEQHDRVRVVADQVGCPTNADDLAVAILAISNRLLAGWQASFAGVFHAAGSGATSWHGLAEAVFAAAAAQGRNVPEVVAISTAEYPTPARRPADSRLDCTKLFDVLDIRMPDWRPGVARTVSQIVGRAAVPAAAVA